MDISDHRMAHEPAHALNGFSDYRRPQMSHMQRLGHVGSAVIHDHCLRLRHLVHPVLLSGLHLVHISGQETGADL